MNKSFHISCPWMSKSKHGVRNDEMRKSAIAWIPQLDRYKWIYEKLGVMVEEANNAVWKFNLYSMNEQIQYTEYYQNGGHYDYHLGNLQLVHELQYHPQLLF